MNMYCGWRFPTGPDNSPYAPWNESEPHYVPCGACGGKGKHWYACDVESGRETECTEETWRALPETDEEADTAQSSHIKGSVETCDICNGYGEVEYEEDFIPDFED